MIRILVISDTHGMNNFIENEIEKIGVNNIHAIIHAGDCVSDAEDISYIYPTIPMYNVAGNNDFYSRVDTEMTATIGGVKIFIAHGHGYRVKYEHDFHTLATRAKVLGAEIAVFGHTHVANLSYLNGITLLNPGSAGYSERYAIIEIENNQAKAMLV